MRAWRSIIRLQLRLAATLGRDLQAHAKLSGADYEILVALTDAPDGRQRFQDLSRAIEWERTRLSHQVARQTGALIPSPFAGSRPGTAERTRRKARAGSPGLRGVSG